MDGWIAAEKTKNRETRLILLRNRKTENKIDPLKKTSIRIIGHFEVIVKIQTKKKKTSMLCYHNQSYIEYE
jgi:hypothetical protein